MEIQLDKAYPRVPPMVSAVCLLSFFGPNSANGGQDVF